MCGNAELKTRLRGEKKLSGFHSGPDSCIVEFQNSDSWDFLELKFLVLKIIIFK